MNINKIYSHAYVYLLITGTALLILSSADTSMKSAKQIINGNGMVVVIFGFITGVILWGIGAYLLIQKIMSHKDKEEKQ